LLQAYQTTNQSTLYSTSPASSQKLVPMNKFALATFAETGGMGEPENNIYRNRKLRDYRRAEEVSVAAI